MNLLAELAKVPLFKDLPPQDLQWLADHGALTTAEEGDQVFKKGSSIDSLRILLQGKVNLYIEQAGQLRSLGAFEKGDITGLLPYSRLRTAVGAAIAAEKSIIYELHKDNFPEMIREHHELTAVLVHSMTDRVRDFTKQQQQNDKMMALGKLSAGLAHELNNPSAAVVRSARELKKHLSNLPEKFKSVIKIKTTDEVVDQVNELVFNRIAEYGKVSLSLMEKSEKEDEMAEWLEAHAIKNSYELAETFVEFGLTIPSLENLKTILRDEDLSAVINWINQVLNTERLVNEIEEASRRINDLVTSVKSYTHMDQAVERKRVDIHLGIRNTVKMLNHKLKKSNLELIERFDDNLPEVNIYVSEMNQVWTNLIDNAIDAMEGQQGSKLELVTKRDGAFVNVSIIDNGPGVPDDIKDKIFDPFYTTKPIGKGTGLGLDVVQQIVNQHKGKIYLHSQPGHTEFRVCMPID